MASFNLIRLLAKPFQFPAVKPQKLPALSEPVFSGPLVDASKAAAKKSRNVAARANLKDRPAPASKLTQLKSKLGLLSHALELDAAFAKKPSRKDAMRSVASAKPRHAMELSREPVRAVASLQTAFTRQSKQAADSFTLSRNASTASSSATTRRRSTLSTDQNLAAASFDNWDTSVLFADLPLILEEEPAASPAPGVMALRDTARVASMLLTSPHAPFRLLDQAAESQESVSRYSSMPTTPTSFRSQESSGVRRNFLGSTAANSEETLATQRSSVSSDKAFRVKSEAFSLENQLLTTIDSLADSTDTLVEGHAFVLPALKFEMSSLLYDVLRVGSDSLKRQNTSGGRVLVEGRPYYEFF